jgi:predicted metal-dependent phosphoesterase TrpH
MSSVTFDLQAHSIHSDGELPAAEVVERAAAAGVELLALTDHDTVDGVEEATMRAEELGIRNVAAAEISSVQDEFEDLHILGYGLDVRDEHLLAELARYREDRGARADRMRAALEELGWAIDPAPLDRRRIHGKPIGRPHLAQAAFKHPANADRIAEEGLEDFSALLVAYLIPGAPAYRRRTFPTVEEAIALIHDAGGVAVWAHPFWDLEARPAGRRDDRPLQGDGPGRRRGLLRHPHPRADRPARGGVLRARAAQHRIE